MPASKHRQAAVHLFARQRCPGAFSQQPHSCHNLDPGDIFPVEKLPNGPCHWVCGLVLIEQVIE
eukprot:11038756-Lingulodinium_polyedra.AAC.2